jgi:hypothetical protein
VQARKVKRKGRKKIVARRQDWYTIRQIKHRLVEHVAAVVVAAAAAAAVLSSTP